MKIRFQADSDLNQTIVKALRRLEPSIDFQTAHAANLRGVPDPDVLAYAAKEGRVLVSHDITTIPQHFGAFIQTADSAGVLIALQEAPLMTVVEDLLLLWMVDEAEDWINRIRILPL
jgi:hypothetical protein